MTFQFFCYKMRREDRRSVEQVSTLTCCNAVEQREDPERFAQVGGDRRVNAMWLLRRDASLTEP